MKKLESKAELREELERATSRFLQKGGQVKQIPNGISGKEPGDPPVFLNQQLFTEPRSARTPVPEVVAAIEARRLERFKRTPAPKRSRLPKPRRKTIYDDFGEPLRTVWVEE